MQDFHLFLMQDIFLPWDGAVSYTHLACAAASFISSVICFARPSNAPLKIPGKATTLLTWLGKSERPVPVSYTHLF